MSTTTADVREEHLSQEEIEKLAHPQRPLRQRIGVVLSYVGMGVIVLYCIIPFYWMVVSALRDPPEGRAPSSSRARRRSITTRACSRHRTTSAAH